MTVGEFISGIFSGTNVSTDDTGISKRWLYGEARSTRAELIKQEFTKNRLFDGVQTQVIDDFKLLPDKIGLLSVLKSVRKIPKFIEMSYGTAIDGIYLKMVSV